MANGAKRLGSFWGPLFNEPSPETMPFDQHNRPGQNWHLYLHCGHTRHKKPRCCDPNHRQQPFYKISSPSGLTIVLNFNCCAGDDCISIQTGCTNVYVHNVNCGPGHGISIGGLGKDNTRACVSNITVRDVNMHNTMNGVRIKTWQVKTKIPK